MAFSGTELLIGVDGGGSTCRFALLHDGRRVDLHGGPANVSTDFEGAVATLTDGLAALARAAGLTAKDLRPARAYLGLAGVVSTDIALRLAQALPLDAPKIADDRIATVTGALADRDGTVLGIGTGSFLGRRVDGRMDLIGGWGLVLGDEASAADLGRRLLRHVLHGLDGLAEASALTAQVLNDLGGAAGIVGFAADARPEAFGALAPRIVAAARAGDPVARAVMQEGVDYIGQGLARLGWQPDEPIVPVGGLAGEYVPYLPEKMARHVAQPVGTALDGALALAAELGGSRG